MARHDPVPQNRSQRAHELLHFDDGALILELLLQLCGFVLRHAFLHGLAAGLDEVLGFFQAETSNGADFLDDVDLLVAT